MPDLVIVDGGKGQVSAAHDAMRNLGVGQIPLAGLAKRFEELYVKDVSEPIVLPRTSQALYLVQRVRDEAHRFAVTYHRGVRQKTGMQSALDAIAGVGPKRKKALLRKFGSVKAIREATVESLPSAPPQMEEGAVARLREMIVASFQSDGLLGLGVRVLMALLFHGDNDEYPASAVEALEESVGIALSRGRLDVALEILNGVRSGSLRGEWFREHNQRSAALFRRAADQTHIGLVVGLLKDHRTSERAELIGEYLRLVGEHGLREFVTQLAEERSRPVRAFMCHILVRVGRPAVPSLRLLTEDRRWYVARNAVTVLGRIGDRSALPSIHEAARYPDPRVRKEAARVLGAWADGETLTPLLALLGDPDRDVTVTVIKVLGRLGLEEGIRPLENLALARAGRPVESAIREEAIRALAAMKTRPAREAIREIAHRRLWLWQRQERQIRSLAVRAARGERIA